MCDSAVQLATPLWVRPILDEFDDRARERYSLTADALVAFLYESPVFSSRFHGLIRQGIEAYLQGDHLKAIYALVPPDRERPAGVPQPHRPSAQQAASGRRWHHD